MKLEIHKLLAQTQDVYGIVGKELAERLQISPSHLSDIRNGKAWPKRQTLERMLVMMDEMAPGSRRHFCCLLAGVDVLQDIPVDLSEYIDELVEKLPNEVIPSLLTAIAAKYRAATYHEQVSEYTDKVNDYLRV